MTSHHRRGDSHSRLKMIWECQSVSARRPSSGSLAVPSRWNKSEIKSTPDEPQEPSNMGVTKVRCLGMYAFYGFFISQDAEDCWMCWTKWLCLGLLHGRNGDASLLHPWCRWEGIIIIMKRYGSHHKSNEIILHHSPFSEICYCHRHHRT